MVIVLVKEVRLVIAVDDLDFKLKMLHLKQRCSIGITPLIKFQIIAWKIQVMHICIVICWTWQF
jgi:hypothetical protein